MKDSLKKSAILAAATAMMAGMTSCGPQVPFNGTQTQFGSFANGAANVNRGPAKKWNVMIHLAADNNLYPFGLEDVNEMEQGLGENPNAASQIDVFVLFDGTPKGDSKILRIKPDPGPLNNKIISEVVDDKGAVIPPSHEIDSGDPVTSAKFVDFITKNFPAEHTAHLNWNHGAGWQRNLPTSAKRTIGNIGTFFDVMTGGEVSDPRAPITRGFNYDDSGHNMGLKDVGTYMAPALRNLGKPMDIVGFDACLMQHIETAYQFKGLANILVASEELEPGKGQDYHAFIGALAKNPNISPVDLSKAMVQGYNAQYVTSGDDATQSALDINAVTNVFVPALNELSNELKAGLSSAKPAIASAREHTQVFYNRDVADIGDFLRQYNKVRGVSAASSKLQQAMAQTVIAEAHTGSSVQGATGAVLYFPTATMNVSPKYDDVNFIRFAETKGWSSFLHAFTGK